MSWYQNFGRLLGYLRLAVCLIKIYVKARVKDGYLPSNEGKLHIRNYCRMDIRIEIPIMDDTMESGIFINFLGYKNNNVFSHRECLEDLLYL